MYIRGIYTTFCDRNFRAKGYIPSYDNVDFYKGRTKIIDEIIETCNLNYISGNVGNVTEYINEKHKQLILK